MKLETKSEMKQISIKFSNIDAKGSHTLKNIYNGIKNGENAFKIYFKRERTVFQLNILACRLASILNRNGIDVDMPISNDIIFGKSISNRDKQHEGCYEQTVVEINYVLQFRN